MVEILADQINGHPRKRWTLLTGDGRRLMIFGSDDRKVYYQSSQMVAPFNVSFEETTKDSNESEVSIKNGVRRYTINVNGDIEVVLRHRSYYEYLNITIKSKDGYIAGHVGFETGLGNSIDLDQP